MQLSDREIHAYLNTGRLFVVGVRRELPFDPVKQVQPASIDLRLDSRIISFNSDIELFDVKDLENVWRYMSAKNIEKNEKISIPPRGILFCQIYEQLKLPDDVSGRIIGRSRVARLGISVHCTGEYINPGFEGSMPLQLVNHNSFTVALYPYMTICQLVLHRTTSLPIIPYSTRSNNPYNREKNAGPSVCHEDEALKGEIELTIQSEVERRLVLNYLEQLKKDELMSEVKKETEEKSAEIQQRLESRPSVQQTFTGSIYGVAGNVQGNQVIQAQQRNLAEAATEIQQLLDHLSRTNPTETASEKIVVVGKAIEQIENDPTLKQRILSAIRYGGIEALKELINHPLVNVLVSSMEGWKEGG